MTESVKSASFCLAQDAIGGADYEVDGWLVEGVVSEFDPVELAQDEGAHVILVQPFRDDGVGYATLDVLVDAEVEVGK